jgi:hypothetical protein
MYVDSVTDWQDRQDGSMPTVTEQQANRRLSSGIRPSISLIEYVGYNYVLFTSLRGDDSEQTLGIVMA